MQYLSAEDLINIRAGLDILDPCEEEAIESVARTIAKVERVHHADGHESASTLRVLLADEEDVLVVEVPDEATGERLGSAAIFNHGGVSAWRIRDPEVSHPDDVALLIEVLRKGADLGEFRDTRDHRDAGSDHDLGDGKDFGGN